MSVLNCNGYFRFTAPRSGLALKHSIDVGGKAILKFVYLLGRAVESAVS